MKTINRNVSNIIPYLFALVGFIVAIFFTNIFGDTFLNRCLGFSIAVIVGVILVVYLYYEGAGDV